MLDKLKQLSWFIAGSWLAHAALFIGASQLYGSAGIFLAAIVPALVGPVTIAYLVFRAFNKTTDKVVDAIKFPGYVRDTQAIVPRRARVY